VQDASEAGMRAASRHRLHCLEGAVPAAVGGMGCGTSPACGWQLVAGRTLGGAHCAHMMRVCQFW
jgi:hypothetical protein